MTNSEKRAYFPQIIINRSILWSVLSSENGGYNVQFLPVGAYELTTDMPSFKRQVRRGINLAVGREAVVNLTLEVGAAAELVTVTDEAPIVNTTLSSTSGLINEAQIKDLPLNGRSFDQLLTLNVGTGFWNLDTSLAKKFSATEQVSMQFRAEAFNVFNHANFASPNPVVFPGNNYSSSAGAITSTSTASRQIQFTLKLLF